MGRVRPTGGTIGRIEAGLTDPKTGTLRRLLKACGQELEAGPILGQGVDRSQIRERLVLTPAQRIAEMVRSAAAIRRLAGSARRAT